MSENPFGIFETALKSDDRSRRVAGAESLAKLASKRSIIPLIRLLSDKDWSIRKIAANGLIKIGSPSHPALVRQLNSENADMRYWTIKILSELGEISLEEIIDTLNSRFPDSRKFAAMALGNMKFPQAIPHLANAFADNSYVVRIEAANAIVKFEAQALPFLDNSLNHHDPDIKYWAIRCIGIILGRSKNTNLYLHFFSNNNPDKHLIGIIAFGESLDPVGIEHLIRSFSGTSLEIRKEASNALNKYSAAAIPLLKKALSDDNEDIRHWSWRTLGNIIQKMGRNAISTLGRLTTSDDTQMQAVSISALGQTHQEEAVSLIIPFLGSPFLSIREIASNSLVNLGYKAIPKLISSLNSNNEFLAHHGSITLGRVMDLVDARAIEIFMNMLKGNVKKELVVKALGETKNPNAIAILLSLLMDDRWSVKNAAALALAGFGEKAVSSLFDGLQSKDEERQYWSTIALAEMAPRVGGKAIDGLILSLDGADKEKKLIAIEGLAKLKEKKAVLSLCEHLSDEFWPVRRAASGALSAMGIFARDDVRQIMLSSQNKDARFWARKTLEQIGPDQEF